MFEDALEEAAERLTELTEQGLIDRFCLIGGFAVAAWGVPRATADLDFAIQTNHQSLESFPTVLKATVRVGVPSDPLAAVVSFETRNGVPVQCALFPPPINGILFEEIIHLEFGSQQIPVIGWKQLMLLKLYAGSAVDFEDASRILALRSPTEQDIEELRAKADQLSLTERMKKITT